MDSKTDIIPWELLRMKMTWEQLGPINHKRILDFGSGTGMTADHFAKNNEVIAIEPNNKMFQDRFVENEYSQIIGDSKYLSNFEDESFDVIFCHNVLEYVENRKEILKEFSRLLKKNGYLSVTKHNRAGRIIQMVVLANNFEHANELLAGENGNAEKFGTVHFYEDMELIKWCNDFVIERVQGLRTFWALQQNQEIQKDLKWQEQMLEIESKVSGLEEFKAIASFHHVILRKNN